MAHMQFSASNAWNNKSQKRWNMQIKNKTEPQPDKFLWLGINYESPYMLENNSASC